MSNIKKEFLEFGILGIEAILFAIVFGSVFGFAQGGFELQENVTKFTIYGVMFPAALFLLIFFKGRALIKKEEEINVAIHDPKEPPALFKNFFIVRNPLLLYIASIIVFAVLGLFAVQTNTIIAGIPNVAQESISPAASLYFAVEPAATAESLFISLALLSFVMFIINILFFKGKASFLYFVIIYAILVPLWGFVGVGYHDLVYGGDQPANVAVWIFWAAQAFLYTSTGSWIPVVWAHRMNNFFFALSLSFSNQQILIWTIGGIVLITLIGVGLIGFFRKRSRGGG